VKDDLRYVVLGSIAILNILTPKLKRDLLYSILEEITFKGQYQAKIVILKNY
jgi:hypothetical protein